MSLFELLTPDTVLLAGGQRLARHLAQQYAREARERGLAVWDTPTILTYGAWLARNWNEALDAGLDRRVLLSPAQEAVLWERVIAGSSVSAQLLSATATATLAREAWNLMHAWEIPPGELKKTGHEDVQAFAAWAQAFETLCDEKRWLDGARLPAVLAELIAAKRLRAPAHLVLSGFDELTPQQQRLFDALERVGCARMLLARDAEPAARCARQAFASFEEEMHAAARWARVRLDANPHTRIGILAPDLSSQNHAIRRIFDDALVPASILPGRQDVGRPYNVSVGERLASLPLVQTAFATLEFAQGALPIGRLSEWLRSAYLAGGETELSARALLDRKLRKDGDMRVSLETLMRALVPADAGVPVCPLLAERLTRFRELRTSVARAQAPSRWSSIMAQLLASVGWPGDRARSSVEHQAIEAWRELLSAFGALDGVLPSLRYGDALARLRRLAQEQMFQRETPETPVQILGVLEASGIEFDALWVMGLHDEVWPSPSRPNPFLPIGLQRRRGLPHASPERELEFCARLTQRLLTSAPDVVFSHPLRDEDRDLRPSPLIRAIPEGGGATAAFTELYRDVVHGPSLRESINDEQAPAFAPNAEARGGTALFRSQSACPFRGYAEFRLGTDAFPEPEPGLSAADRGTLVHDVLAALWQELASHAGLIACPKDQLVAKIAQLATRQLQRLKQRRPQTLTEPALALEQERLLALILEWLEIERLRAPFKVRREEAGTYLSVAGLRTKGRMDRVDELHDGTLAVIDYKTGAARIADWLGERLAEPQLPLYALYGVPRSKVSAVFYGGVRRGDHALHGFARADGVAPGVKPYADTREAARIGPWEKLLEQWDRSLIALAEEHRDGHARVSPRNRQACDHCHLHSLCRVHERRARLSKAESDEEGAHD